MASPDVQDDLDFLIHGSFIVSVLDLPVIRSLRYRQQVKVGDY